MRYYNNTVRIISFLCVCLLPVVSHAEHVMDHIHRPQIFLSEIPPLIMQEDGEDSGLLVDLAYALIDEANSKGLDMRPSPKILPWARAYKFAQEKPNVIMMQMARVPYREDLFNWVDTTTEMSWSFVSTTTPPIDTVEQAKKLDSVAVYRASRLEDQLREFGFNTTLTLTNDSSASARMLDKGRVKAWYASVHAAQWLHKSGTLEKKPIIGKPIMTIPLWLIASKGTPPETVEILSKAIGELNRSGLIKALHQKYGLNQ